MKYRGTTQIKSTIINSKLEFMKKQIFFLTILMLSFYNSFGQKTIAVQSNGTATFYTDWATAWTATQAGDTIYLPGGTFNIGYFTINKQVAIIGVGHDPTQTHDNLFSHLNGTIFLAEGADGSLFHGFQTGTLYFTNSSYQNQNIANITISRCSISNVNMGYTSPSPVQHVVITESILGHINGLDAQNVQINKNIIDGYVQQFNGTTIFSNNIFSFGYYSNWTWHLPTRNIKNSLFQNNIFKVDNNPLDANCQNNLLQNNIFFSNFTPNPQTDENIWQNNFFNQAFENVFVNYTGGAFNPGFDYHLLPSSVGVDAGVDGYDIGIYGTAVPYKEGAVPFNPQVVFEQVSNQTDENGNISIEVEIAAQPR
jgi:hypothetical protein